MCAHALHAQVFFKNKSCYVVQVFSYEPQYVCFTSEPMHAFFQDELLDITWVHLTEADRIPPPALIKERFCKKLEEGNYHVAISCIAKTNPDDLQAFSKTAWLNLFKENAERFHKDTLVQLVREVSILTAKSDEANPVFENLMMCCRELDRTSVMTGDFKPNESVYTVQTEPAYS